MTATFRWITGIVWVIVATIFFFQGDFMLGLVSIIQGMFFILLDLQSDPTLDEANENV